MRHFFFLFYRFYRYIVSSLKIFENQFMNLSCPSFYPVIDFALLLQSFIAQEP